MLRAPVPDPGLRSDGDEASGEASMAPLPAVLPEEERLEPKEDDLPDDLESPGLLPFDFLKSILVSLISLSTCLLNKFKDSRGHMLILLLLLLTFYLLLQSLQIGLDLFSVGVVLICSLEERLRVINCFFWILLF